MKRYEKYKNSGIEWLGEIPEHWEIKRVKDISAKVGDGLHGTPIYSDDSTYFFINGNNLQNRFIDLKNARTISQDVFNAIKISFNSQTMFLSINGTIGNLAFYNNEKIAIGKSVAYTTLKHSFNKSFLYYHMLADTVLNSFEFELSGTTIKNLSLKTLRDTFLFVPPLQEQTTIAKYLDTKTAAINRKIELLTAKASKYKAFRLSLINETVCRGLNPNVPLKDSGIEWIGMVPEHWEVKRMKDIGFLFSGLSGKAGDDFNQDENENNRDFIPFTNIFNNDTINPHVMGKVVVFENEKQNKVKKNDLFFLMSSEDYDGLGKSSLLTIDLQETYLNSFCKGFRITKKQVFPAFLNYQLQSDTFRKVMQIEGKGFTRLNLKTEKVTDFKVFIPETIEEQQTIVDYLNNKTTQIDTILSNIGEQIAKLTQLRKTLINDVVTGKLKVTE